MNKNNNLHSIAHFGFVILLCLESNIVYNNSMLFRNSKYT